LKTWNDISRVITHRENDAKIKDIRVEKPAKERNLLMTDPFNLKNHGVTVAEIHHNLPPSALYEHAIRYEKDASIAENGALVAYSGVKTGRSPKDKRVVKHPDSEANV